MYFALNLPVSITLHKPYSKENTNCVKVTSSAMFQIQDATARRRVHLKNTTSVPTTTSRRPPPPNKDPICHPTRYTAYSAENTQNARRSAHQHQKLHPKPASRARPPHRSHQRHAALLEARRRRQRYVFTGALQVLNANIRLEELDTPTSAAAICTAHLFLYLRVTRALCCRVQTRRYQGHGMHAGHKAKTKTGTWTTRKTTRKRRSRNKSRRLTR
jgi:hypothetical protein